MAFKNETDPCANFSFSEVFAFFWLGRECLKLKESHAAPATASSVPACFHFQTSAKHPREMAATAPVL